MLLRTHGDPEVFDGEYAAGAKIPSINDLEEMYGASMGTVERALGILRGQNLITTQQGIGSFVRGGTPRDEQTLTLHDGRILRVVTDDMGTVRIRLDGAPYVLSEVNLKSTSTNTAMIELSPGGQGSRAYTGRT